MNVRCSVMSDFAIPWTVAHQASLSTECSRQKSGVGCQFPSPGNLPNPGIKPRSPALQANSLPSKPLGKPLWVPEILSGDLLAQNYFIIILRYYFVIHSFSHGCRVKYSRGSGCAIRIEIDMGFQLSFINQTLLRFVKMPNKATLPISYFCFRKHF